MTTTCPECAETVTFANEPRVSEIVECHECKTELDLCMMSKC